MASFAETFSTSAVVPTKLSEYLLCGVPAVGTIGIGDTTRAVEADLFFDEKLGTEAAAKWLFGHVLRDREGARVRARQVGLAEFSLERSVQDYLGALRAVTERMAVSDGVIARSR